jgi:hypothetical protein
MASHEFCSNNSFALKYASGKQFRVGWTGESYLHGIAGHQFDLDAVGTLTSVSISGELESGESRVDDVETRRIFASVFPNGDFHQQPTKIERIEEDGLVLVQFRVEFTPK